MNKKILALSGMLALAVLMSGCVSTEDGQMRMGVPFTKDTFESLYARPASQIWVAAREVLTRNGKLVSDNTVAGTLTAKIDTSTVYVKIEDLDAGKARVTVQGRTKYGGADPDLAQEMDKQIALQLR